MNKRQRKKQAKKELARAEQTIELLKNIDWENFGKAVERVAEAIKAGFERAAEVIKQAGQRIIKEVDEQQKEMEDLCNTTT